MCCRAGRQVFICGALECIMGDNESHQAQSAGREAGCRLLQLPSELLGHIFSFISAADKAQARKKLYLAQSPGSCICTAATLPRLQATWCPGPSQSSAQCTHLLFSGSSQHNAALPEDHWSATWHQIVISQEMQAAQGVIVLAAMYPACGSVFCMVSEQQSNARPLV